MSQTLIISMTVVAWGVLVAVMAVQTFLAIYLIRENRRIVAGQSVHERLAALGAGLSGLRKEHSLLRESVETYISRENVRAGRAKREYKKKDKDDDDEPELPGDVFFPTTMSSPEPR